MRQRLPRITLICQWPTCQQPFEVSPSRFRAKPQKFCSRHCLAKYMKSQQNTGTLAEHFWAKTQKGLPHECWYWQASKTRGGYGILYVLEKKRTIGAHVVSWFLCHGTWPEDGLWVLHNCPGGDNPACVNPAHLWLGTHIDNMQDCVRKGRQGHLTHPEKVQRGTRHWAHLHPERLAHGSRNHKTKLTDQQRRELLELHATGEWSLTRLAKHYGVTPQSIWARIKRDKST